jgi:hypothetical protein
MSATHAMERYDASMAQMTAVGRDPDGTTRGVKSPVVLVLASGRGERFVASGGKGSKLQALLGGQPVLEHTLAAVRASGLPYHVEDAGHPGMGDSIAAGVRATADAGAWLVLPGDLPLVAPASLHAVVAALAAASLVLPNTGPPCRRCRVPRAPRRSCAQPGRCGWSCRIRGSSPTSTPSTTWRGPRRSCARAAESSPCPGPGGAGMTMPRPGSRRRGG